jgi:hypothetical protein
VSGFGQIVRGGHPGKTGTYDRDFHDAITPVIKRPNIPEVFQTL